MASALHLRRGGSGGAGPELGRVTLQDTAGGGGLGGGGPRALERVPVGCGWGAEASGSLA